MCRLLFAVFILVCAVSSRGAHALDIHNGYMDERGQLCPHPDGNIKRECYQPSPEERAQWFRDMRRANWRDSCKFGMKWPWQDSSAYWTKDRDSLYAAYQEQSAKASTLQSQIAQADSQSAIALRSLLIGAQNGMSHTSACMRFTELMAAGGSEEAAFSALGF